MSNAPCENLKTKRYVFDRMVSRKSFRAGKKRQIYSYYRISTPKQNIEGYKSQGRRKLEKIIELIETF